MNEPSNTGEFAKIRRRLKRKSNLRSAFTILSDWTVIFVAAVAATIADNVFATIAAIVVIGAKEYCLGEVLVHEACHNNLFASRSWNVSLQFLFAYPFFSDVVEYRAFHLPHHRYLGTENDELCKSYDSFGLSTGRTTNHLWIWFARPLLGIVSYCHLKEMYKNTDFGQWKVTIGVYVIITLSLSALGLFQEFLLYWVVPYLTVFPTLYYWQEIDDHYNTRGMARTNVGWIRNFLTHNSGYHYPHHMCMGIPWYNLKTAYRLLYSDCKGVSHGYIGTYLKIRELIPHQDRYPIFSNRIHDLVAISRPRTRI